MPVYKPEGNKLVRIFCLTNELFQSREIKDVGFNPELILRRFYKIGVNFSENAIFKKVQ